MEPDLAISCRSGWDRPGCAVHAMVQMASHNQRVKTAGLALDQNDVEHVSEGAEIWEKVVRKLRSGAMPPPGSPRPDKATYDGFAY